jgi:hypothetical protein
MTAELVFIGLFPAPPTSLPTWFGLPIMHASLLVALVAGPWLALATFVLVHLARPVSRTRADRRWGLEVLAVVGGCIATGLAVASLYGWLDNLSPPIDPSIPPAPTLVERKYIRSAASPKLGDPNCSYNDRNELICKEYVVSYTRFDTHRDGFINLPGWLSLSQAVAILVSLGMIIPASMALSVRPSKRLDRLSVPLLAVTVGFMVSAVIGLGLEIASAPIHLEQNGMLNVQGANQGVLLNPYDLPGSLQSALMWGCFGMVSAYTASALDRLLGNWFKRRQGGRLGSLDEESK